MPQLSVIVAVYNSEKYLAACLKSIISQSVDLELIAVNDASPDDSARILNEYALADKRVRVLSLPKNGGVSEARNAGLDVAVGDYVWFIDNDDWLVEGAAKKLLDRANSTCADVVLFGWWEVGLDGRTWRGKE